MLSNGCVDLAKKIKLRFLKIFLRRRTVHALCIFWGGRSVLEHYLVAEPVNAEFVESGLEVLVAQVPGAF